MKKMTIFILAIMTVLVITAVLCACGDDVTETTGAVTTEGTTAAVTTDLSETDTSVTETTATSAETTTTVETTTEETTTSAETTTEEYREFYDDQIVLSFAAVSDTHVSFSKKLDDATAKKFIAAMDQLKAKALENDPDGLDAVLIVGDLINGYLSDDKGYYTTTFKTLYEKEFDVNEVPLIYCLGDGHDLSWKDDKVYIQRLIDRLGEAYYQTDIEPELISEGTRHCVVNGYHILSLEPCSRYPITYTAKTKEWLDKTLAEITEKDPNSYVFVITHPMIEGTTYGSNFDLTSGSWATKDLTTILEKYPQVITFGGHLHYPVNDERSIMQQGFTAVGTGAVYYLCAEPEYVGMSGNNVPDAYNCSQGLLVQVDAKGNVKITRMDFKNEQVIKEPWILSAPDAEGTNLTKYTEAGRMAVNTAPTFDVAPEVTVSNDGTGKGNVLVRIHAAKDDDVVHHYTVKVKNLSNDAVKTYKYLTDFYMVGDISQMKSEVQYTITGLSGGKEYDIIVTAVDCWGVESEPTTVRISTMF